MLLLGALFLLLHPLFHPLLLLPLLLLLLMLVPCPFTLGLRSALAS